MLSIFDVEFDQLTVEHVHSFLRDAGEEGLNWEAKGAKAADGTGLRPEGVRNAVCALANQIGGWVLIGAVRTAGGWELAGVAPPSQETGLWVDQVIDGLRPRPRCRHHLWALGGGRVAAVIEVQPTTETPVMTRDGQVFERVSSESIRVKDPLRLHELIARGRNARECAVALADRATEPFAGEAGWDEFTVRFIIGLAATSYQPDIGSRLFHSRFPDQVRDLIDARCFTDLHQERTSEPQRLIRQSYLQLLVDTDQLRWVVRPSWDGSVSVLAAVRAEHAANFAATDFAL